MSPENHFYFQRRAEEELERAQTAEHPEAVKAHYHLAGFYLDLIYGDQDAIEPEHAESGAAGLPLTTV